MPVIILITIINASVKKVFDLARNIDLHQQSMLHTKEKAIGGRVSGLIEEGETVTWQANHLFQTRKLTSRIVSMKPPHYFRDEMIEGDFKSMAHDHYFTEVGYGTEMKDVFIFKMPYRFAGRLVAWIFLTKYMRKLLAQRNSIIKKTAEGIRV